MVFERFNSFEGGVAGSRKVSPFKKVIPLFTGNTQPNQFIFKQYHGTKVQQPEKLMAIK